MHHPPLESRVRLAWQFTGEGDTMWLECGHGSDLAQDVLMTLLGKLSPDPSPTDFITPPLVGAALCSEQAMRMRLLRELPTLNKISIAVW